jgi:eukaryotic-like serine/threonine-protein kinase
MVGKVLNSRYELKQLIGSGGMADVYMATDTLLGRTVAVKILHPQYAKDQVFVARFRQEAQAAANLNQVNIVNVYDWGIEDSTYYLVMEYVEGRDLKDIILQGGQLLPERAVEIAMSICLALEAAHAQGIVHRDIKPQNVIVTYDNKIKVMDFGIARTTGGSAMTETGTIMGTAQYISPEQAQGRAADPRSDLYSLGVVLYEMLTGKVPFDGENPVAIAYKHVREDPLPPSMINPDISPELEAVVMKGLSKNPENRYQSSVEMYSDLERCLEGAPVYATPVLPPQEATLGATRAYPAVPAKPRKRSLAWLWIAIICLVALVGIGIGAWALVSSIGGVAVPQVVGLNTSDAEQRLNEAGLEMKVEKTVIDPQKPKDTIISQDPSAGSKLDKGGTVQVVVSKGVEKVTVPELTGMNQSDASAALSSAGLKLGEVSQDYNTKVEKGLVISQSPSSGEEVAKNSEVAITVSRGPQVVAVPNVSGKTQDAATQALTAVGLQVQVETETSTEVQEGLVISQSPAAGENVPKGSTVTITVSKQQTMIDVPNVVGMQKDAAQSELENKGFVVNVIQTVDPTKTVNQVYKQVPTSPSKAPAGSSVTIYVWAKNA